MTPPPLSATARALVDLAVAHHDEANSTLSRLLQFRTENQREAPDKPNPACQAEIKKCFAWMKEWGTKEGFVVKNYDDLVVTIEAPGTGPESVGVALHVDVVPTPGNWTHGAYSGDIADGYIWGRGAQDDKGPTAQCMVALKLLKKAGIPMKRSVRLIIGSTEETGLWECVKHYLNVEEAPTFTMVPDADFPIICGEKGFLTLVVEGTWNGSQAPERAGGLKFTGIKCGVAENIVPETCIVHAAGPMSALTDVKRVVKAMSHACGRTMFVKAEPDGDAARFEIHVVGKAAHSSVPWDGLNAAIAALQVCTALWGESHPAMASAAWLLRAASDDFGAGLDIKLNHSFVGPTTASLTMLTLDGSHVKAEINTRFTMGLTIDETMTRAQRIADEVTVAKLTVTAKPVPREPIYVDPKQFGPFIDALMKSYHQVQGKTGEPYAIGGTTFAKAFPRAVCFGPVDETDGEPSLAHQCDERITTVANLRNLKIYTLALARLAAADSSI